MGILSYDIDSMLLPVDGEHKKSYPDLYITHYLEQYRIYLHIFNATIDRRQKSNEFFLGLNTAIIALLGYIETKATPETQLVFLLIPFVGMAICVTWFGMIRSYRKLSRAKFTVVHTLERKLPATLFETEWELLGRGKDRKKYVPLSQMEKMIPLTFIVLYAIILFASIFPPAHAFIL